MLAAHLAAICLGDIDLYRVAPSMHARQAVKPAICVAKRWLRSGVCLPLIIRTHPLC